MYLHSIYGEEKKLVLGVFIPLHCIYYRPIMGCLFYYERWRKAFCSSFGLLVGDSLVRVFLYSIIKTSMAWWG